MRDHIDLKILELLQQDARMQWTEMGRKLGLSRYAVASRIRRMEEDGTILRYTIVLGGTKPARNANAFVTVKLEGEDHSPFLQFLQRQSTVAEVHLTSGVSCYVLLLEVETNDELNQLLSGISRYGSYELHVSFKKVK